jgi:DNA-binding transcriptional LysR family regulator
MDRITQMELFVQTVKLGSITRAAEKLGLSDPAASRSLSSLEERLGARLLERTTRRLWLTEAGQAYHARCLQLLADLAEADAKVSEHSSRPSGVLALTSSPSFAMLHIAPALPEFQRLYPGISVRILAANHYEDVIDSGVDIAIRTRPFEPDSSISVRKLAHARYVTVASPEYLAAHGAPAVPADLAKHAILIYGFSREHLSQRFTRDDQSETVQIQPALLSTEGKVLCAAALAGGGILFQPTYTIYDEVLTGALVPVLTEWQLAPIVINLAYHTRKLQPAKIRVFMDFLLQYFERQRLEEKWTDWPPKGKPAAARG